MSGQARRFVPTRREGLSWWWLEVLVLAVLAERPLHRMEVLEALVERGVMTGSGAGVGPLISGMARRGLVEVASYERTAGRGASRRRYRLTSQGERQLGERAEATVPTLRAMAAMLEAPLRRRDGIGA